MALAFPEEPKAIRKLMGKNGQAIAPGGALRPVLQDLWQEAEQRAAWGFLRLVTTERCPAIGTGDTESDLFAGMRAAVVISLRVFPIRGAGKTN